ncbi:MAG: response regulator transcription factor [Armatimonadota bacterium]|nr:response regulator transcription factor [Armatimonadota bacterium]MDR7427176.1 response regulator transcription factor [Armatimonadota bacterium]MDR7465410.1 response regulator transcription factor [Armatimonadota bacterium]MDR7473541.1 response regulator transcription factor [Armatimonadota bacterium]MDR7539980.1 response regulator transcription factor [Armatimonadota bacterium]
MATRTGEGARPEEPRAAPRILVVDDEPHIVELVRYNLQQEGFAVSVAADGREALTRVASDRPDLVVLDIMLPEVDGIEVCRQIRAGSRVPVLMLTARDRELDRVVGLELGADDYVTKPFSPRELVARIRAILRRTGGADRLPETGPLEADGLVLHPETHEVWLHGRPVDLTAKEFELLKLLMRHPNRVFTRDFLLEHIWGYDYFGSTRTVDMHISRLREKIEDDPADPTFIQTVRGVGYKFKAGTRAPGRR